MMNLLSGSDILAKALALHNLQYCYGCPGVPITQLGYAMQGNGIKYFGFKNDHQASHAAGVTGYLTQKPAICLVASDCGHTDAVSGLANAYANSWPMILISGGSDLNPISYQGLQDYDQQILTKPFSKYSARVVSAASIPFHVQKAIRMSLSGRPGPVYLDVPSDILKSKVEDSLINWKNVPIQLPVYVPRENELENAFRSLIQAKRPLLIIGKGAAYGRAANQLREFINRTKIPFLPTPMGKGVIPDSHPQNISYAKSLALSKADLIVLVGARSNLFSNFGYDTKFSPNVKIIQIDIKPDQLSQSIMDGDQLVGDCKQTVRRLNNVIGQNNWTYGGNQLWNKLLRMKCEENQLLHDQLMRTKRFPMNYYSTFKTINKYLPRDSIMVGDASNITDIARTVFTHEEPLKKLEAGNFGTMGVGIPFTIAAKVVHPTNWVVTILDGSNLSGIQFQPLKRYQLGGVIFIINNDISGVVDDFSDPTNYVTGLNSRTKYDMLRDSYDFIPKTKYDMLRDSYDFIPKTKYDMLRDSYDFIPKTKYDILRDSYDFIPKTKYDIFKNTTDFIPKTKYDLVGDSYGISPKTKYDWLGDSYGINPRTKYDILGESLNAIVRRVTTESELERVCGQIFVPENVNRLFVVNVLIDPSLITKKFHDPSFFTRRDFSSKL